MGHRRSVRSVDLIIYLATLTPYDDRPARGFQTLLGQCPALKIPFHPTLSEPVASLSVYKLRRVISRGIIGVQWPLRVGSRVSRQAAARNLKQSGNSSARVRAYLP
jgi:hypothetical protein